MSIKLVALGWLAACGGVTSTPTTPPSAPPTVSLAGQPSLPPGCTEQDQGQRFKEFYGWRERLPAGDPAALLDELRAIAARPCLAWAAEGIRIPPTTTRAILLADGEHLELGSLVQGIANEERGPAIVLPRELRPVPKAIDPILACHDATACTRAQSYVVRAHNAFDDAEARLPLSPFACVDGDQPIGTFPEWLDCVTAEAPVSYRFPLEPLRAPERGWLVIRGRRGHYNYADEIRAYDLTTGAAYIVRREGELFPESPNALPDRELDTGRVAADQLRELAFVLLARTSLVEVRTRPRSVPLPAGMVVTAEAASHMTSFRSEVVTSSQTELGYTFIDGTTRATGTFTWDGLATVDRYVQGLVEVMEAGFVSGCAPAALPSPDQIPPELGVVSAIDSHPSTQKALQDDLAERLEGLRSSACKP